MVRSTSRRRRWLLSLLLLASLMAALWYSEFLGQLSLANPKTRQTALNSWWLAASVYFANYLVAAAVSLPEAEIMTLACGALVVESEVYEEVKTAKKGTA